MINILISIDYFQKQIKETGTQTTGSLTTVQQRPPHNSSNNDQSQTIDETGTEVGRSQEHTSDSNLSTKVLCVIGLSVGAIAGVATAPAVLSAAGFTSSGVAAGSLAASIQSVVYGGATGGLFSLFQSAGARGIGVAGNAVAGSIGAGIGAASVTTAKLMKDRLNEEAVNQEENSSD